MSGLGPPGDASSAGGVRDGDLAGLLARVEQAEGPDRELDFALHHIHLGDWLLRHGYERSGDGYWSDSPPMSGANHVAGPERFTASLDAALALCERLIEEGYPGLQRNRYRPGRGRFGRAWSAYLSGGNLRDEIEAGGHTAPLALIAAVLKALIAQGEDDTAEPRDSPGRTQTKADAEVLVRLSEDEGKA